MGKAFVKGWPIFQGSGNEQYRGPLPPDCKCGRVHQKTDLNSRSSRGSNASFLTKAFLRQFVREAVDKVLKLGLVDGAELGPAQSEEVDSSGTEAQGGSDLEHYGKHSARPYKWGAAPEEVQADAAQAGLFMKSDGNFR